MNVLRTLNTLLLAGILATLILIFLRLREPIAVAEPVAIQGWKTGILDRMPSIQRQPVFVTIDDQPVEVQISR
jgi:hypothetical protein